MADYSPLAAATITTRRRPSQSVRECRRRSRRATTNSLSSTRTPHCAADRQPSSLRGHSGLLRASSRHQFGEALDGRRVIGFGERLGPLLSQTARSGSLGDSSKRKSSQSPRRSAAGSCGRVDSRARLAERGLPPPVLGARPSPVTSGPPVPRHRCRSTSRRASVLETPNAEARGCVRRHRTPPGFDHRV